VSNAIEYNGHTDSIAGWSRRIGIPYGTLSKRFDNGWTTERALTTPLMLCKAHPIVPPITLPTIIHRMRHDSDAQQRELTRMLRQFNRDFAAIMERSLHRGVVADLAKLASDRSLSVAQGLT
jgi:hypothetical protein